MGLHVGFRGLQCTAASRVIFVFVQEITAQKWGNNRSLSGTMVHVFRLLLMLGCLAKGSRKKSTCWLRHHAFLHVEPCINART